MSLGYGLPFELMRQSYGIMNQKISKSQKSITLIPNNLQAALHKPARNDLLRLLPILVEMKFETLNYINAFLVSL